MSGSDYISFIMPVEIRKTPKAKDDLLDLASYIAQENLDAAFRFLDVAESAFNTLAERPEMGTTCDFRSAEAARIRVWSIKGFQSLLIFYRPIEDGIEVVRVLHGARDLGALFSDDTDQ